MSLSRQIASIIVEDIDKGQASEFDFKGENPSRGKTSTKVSLRNAYQITDGQPGDIIILVKVK